MKTIALTTAALLALPAVALVGADSAEAAGHDARVVRHGSCSGATDWTIKVKPDDGRLEVEAEIDGRQAGQRWRWALRHDGALVDRGHGRTHGRSGSFEVERTVRDGRGADHVVLRAVRANGEVCVARVSR